MPHTRLRRGRPRDPTGVQARRTARRRRDRANSSRSGRPRSRPGASGPTSWGGPRPVAPGRPGRRWSSGGVSTGLFQRDRTAGRGVRGVRRGELEFHRRAARARAESGADGREDSPHRAPARRATVIGVDTHDTVTHESPMSDRLATVRTVTARPGGRPRHDTHATNDKTDACPLALFIHTIRKA